RGRVVGPAAPSRTSAGVACPPRRIALHAKRNRSPPTALGSATVDRGRNPARGVTSRSGQRVLRVHRGLRGGRAPRGGRVVGDGGGAGAAAGWSHRRGDRGVAAGGGLRGGGRLGSRLGGLLPVTEDGAQRGAVDPLELALLGPSAVQHRDLQVL